MPLSAGTKLGPYEILTLIGAGGMGEVYKARDNTLKRDVALKVLAVSFLSDPERMARFQREAEVLASLDHPNVGPIYGIVDSEDSRGLVLALVEGPTLADQIAVGPLPLDDALSIAKQIIEALEYAHDRGVVHRDLKPANIKITPEGVVKVLDFGLAKVLEDEPPKSSLGNSPTMTLGHTRAGMILGTAAYMSPEQAIGRPVDRRSDIFSFGAVLFEMLTGKRAFNGAATPDVLEAVVKNDPDWSALPAGTPVYLRRLLERTLAKDRKERLQAIGEARIILAKPQSEEPVSATGATAPSPARFGRLPWIVAAGVMTAVAAVALWGYWRATQPVDRPLARLDVDLGADVSLPVPFAAGSNVAISPDGTRLAYTSGTASGTTTKLFTRRLDQPKATELPGTQGAIAPCFSPDGQWISFMAGGKLNKISVEGGAVVALGDVRTPAGATWGEDGSIIASDAVGKGLLRIRSGGGPPETVAELGSGEIVLAHPRILPGGKAILFAGVTGPDVDRFTIEVLTLADRHRKIVVRGGQSPRYLATSNGGSGRVGHLVYVNKAVLFAIPFDLDKLETRGTAVPVLDDVAFEGLYSVGQLDFSRTGTLVYRKASGGGSVTLKTVQWVDPAGKKEPLLAKPGDYSFASLSPDGKRIALRVTEAGSSDAWIYDPQRDAMTRVTTGGMDTYEPIWSPDGKYLVFGSVGKGIFETRVDGASQPQALTQNKIVQIPWAFTPAGKRVAYFEVAGGGAGHAQLWTVPVEDEGGQLKAGKPEQFLKSNFDDIFPAFSPDGRWLAYQSNESGKPEVYVRAFPPPSSGQGGKWQVSNNGGTMPRWSRNRRDLVYLAGDQLMAADYTVTGDTFASGKPRLWIPKAGTRYDLAPDGKRVAVLTPVESTEVPKQEHEIVMLQNFFDELRRKVPVGK